MRAFNLHGKNSDPYGVDRVHYRNQNKKKLAGLEGVFLKWERSRKKELVQLVFSKWKTLKKILSKRKYNIAEYTLKELNVLDEVQRRRE